MYIGIDIGGTKCAVVKADNNGKITDKVSFKTEDRDTSINKIFDLTEKMGRAKSIGISCGGPLDSKRGVIMSPPNLPGWDNVDIVPMLQSYFGTKAYLQNDANACALAEWQFGAGKGCKNMVFFTFGTGLGAGLILDGRLYSGSNGNAGEAGHIRLSENGPVGYGKAGSFEGFCSGGGIAQLGRIKAMELLQCGKKASFCDDVSKLCQITAKSVADCADMGCEDAIDVYKTCGRYLGKGLSLIVDILNPQKIVIGSIFARSGHLLKDEMQKVLQKECLGASLGVCEIAPAALGENIGDIAAVTVAILGERGEL